MTDRLPIDDVLPELIGVLRQSGRAVLQAPPGAGKTTRVPLAMLQANLTDGRILMLEPRRLAARAAAARMAETLGEDVGQSVGYRIRGEAKVSKASRIEVVTEGILTRMIQSDPELSGVGAVIFDEFHERSLNADLGLALCLEIADALRDDLILLAMSATLDADPVAKLMGNAPLLTSEGRSFPVDIRWRDKPLAARDRLENAVTDTILAACAETEGGILVFLPGEGEIRKTAAQLSPRLAKGHVLRPLYGALPFAEQQAALKPDTSSRKIVLATAIAETSLTIPDIRVVVDAGLARRARFDPGTGMARLVTEKASRAESTQRAGRGGRIAKGIAYRLWTKGEDGARRAFAPAEIETADLTSFALDVALWGADVAQLPLLTPPPTGLWSDALNLLQQLGALDQTDQLTPHGKAMGALPLHPRLAHMLLLAGNGAAQMAALLSERDPLRGAPVDLALRLAALTNAKAFRDTQPYQVHDGALAQMRSEAKRLSKMRLPTGTPLSAAQHAALAYPDGIALRRPGDAPRYLTSGGKGVHLPEDDPLAGQRLLVVTNTDGHPRDARVRLALALSDAELRELFGTHISWEHHCEWSKREGRVLARHQERFGALVLQDRLWKNADPAAIAGAMLEGVRQMGLRHTKAAKRFIARVNVGRAAGLALPDLSDAALLETIDEWLLPHITGITSSADWSAFDTTPALRAMLDWPQTQALDTQVPGNFTTPLGRSIPIDYGGDQPEISLRLQEMFGQTAHPKVGNTPLKVTLLSPAGRPVQTTMDIPGFWATSYTDVRKDMRGRYPKHPWPEDPTQADPTLRAKPRK